MANNNNDDGGKKQSLFEQHAQTGLAVIATSILLGSGGLLLGMREDVQVLKRDVQHLSDSLKTAGDDRFRGADWRREERALNDRFQRLEQRVEKIEGLRAR
jgi:hypothetical protein